jgi:hypothetical protein
MEGIGGSFSRPALGPAERIAFKNRAKKLRAA